MGPWEATFDHGEEGIGLWLDPAVQDDPVYAESWAGHRPVEVTIEEDQIVIRRAGGEEPDDSDESAASEGDLCGSGSVSLADLTHLGSAHSSASRRTPPPQSIARRAYRANAAPATVPVSHASGALGAELYAISKHQSVPALR